MIFGIVAGFFAVGSFLAGLCPVTFGQLSHKQLGLVLVGIWVFFPPIFFWIDWVCFSNELTDEASRDFAKHTHDLSRNIWIAFAAILAYLFEIPSVFQGH